LLSDSSPEIWIRPTSNFHNGVNIPSFTARGGDMNPYMLTVGSSDEILSAVQNPKSDSWWDGMSGQIPTSGFFFNASVSQPISGPFSTGTSTQWYRVGQRFTLTENLAFGSFYSNNLTEIGSGLRGSWSGVPIAGFSSRLVSTTRVADGVYDLTVGYAPVDSSSVDVGDVVLRTRTGSAVRPISTTPVSATDVRYRFASGLSAQNGVYTLEVVPKQVKWSLASPTPQFWEYAAPEKLHPWPPLQLGNTHVLAAGVNWPMDTFPLPSPTVDGAEDARKVASAFEGALDLFSGDTVTTLPLDSAGTGNANAVKSAIRAAEQRVQPGDTFVLIVSSHGLGLPDQIYGKGSEHETPVVARTGRGRRGRAGRRTQATRAQVCRPVPVPPRRRPFVPRQPGAADVPLLGMRGRRKRHRLRDEARPPVLRRGGADTRPCVRHRVAARATRVQVPAGRRPMSGAVGGDSPAEVPPLLRHPPTFSCAPPPPALPAQLLERRWLSCPLAARRSHGRQRSEHTPLRDP
jgi:hypothetical protein